MVTWVWPTRDLDNDALSEQWHMGQTDQSPWRWCSLNIDTWVGWPEPLATTLFQSIDTWVWLTRALGDDALSEHRHLGVTDQSSLRQRSFTVFQPENFTRVSALGWDWLEPLATTLFQSIDAWVGLIRVLGDDALSEHRHLGGTD